MTCLAHGAASPVAPIDLDEAVPGDRKALTTVELKRSAGALASDVSLAQARVVLARADYEAIDQICASAIRMRSDALTALNFELRALDQLMLDMELMTDGQRQWDEWSGQED